MNAIGADFLPQIGMFGVRAIPDINIKYSFNLSEIEKRNLLKKRKKSTLN